MFDFSRTKRLGVIILKKIFRKSLSVLSALSIVSSMTAVGAIAANADNDNNLNTSTSTTTTGKIYSLDEIYTDYLFSHTDKSSEIDNSGKIQNEVANANDDKVYADFNFSQVSSTDKTTSGTTKTMQEQAEDLLNDSATDNPLSGFSFVRPEELLIGQINQDDQHKGNIKLIDNVDKPINELGGIDSLNKAGNNISLSEGKSGQSHNTIGIDYNGDGVDELAYFSLYADGKGYASVRTYNRTVSDGTLSWNEAETHKITISKKDEILDIEAQNSKGYTSMTAGDFDNDGKEELACYFPCANNGYGEPFVGVIDINDDGSFNLDDMKKIYLSSIRPGINDLQSGSDNYEGWYMPIVALSTTSIRANGAEDRNKSYDDLVINISIPRVYHDNNANMNSCIAIYSYDNGSWNNKFKKDLRFNDLRMISTNSVDADLNGDGYKELVVAGMQEYGVTKDTGKFSISHSENLVQLIYWNGNSYNMVWDTPVRVASSGQVKLDWNAQEPIALTAGRYNPNTPITMEYLCIQGVVLSCQNSKVYGIEEVAPEDTDINKAVIETLPYKDAELFADAFFNTEYKTDIQKLVEAEDNAFISTADSGMFYVAGQTETIVLLTGDDDQANHDLISYDIILLSCDTEGNWVVKAYDDYMHFVNEDDKGTYMSMCFLDCDNDQMYYKYKSKTVGYSSPTLYSVVQAPPYYEENNTASVSYTVTSGTTTGYQETWGVGGGIGVGGKVGNTALVGTYIGSYTNSTSYSKSTTLNLYTDMDYAVSMVIPVVICTYDVWIPNGNNGAGEWTEMVTSVPLEPAFAALPIDQYNELANSLTDKEQRNAAPVIDNLPDSSAGDPYGYNSSSDALNKDISVHQNDKDKLQETEVCVNTDTISKSNSVSVTESTDTTNGFSVAWNNEINIKFVTIYASADFSYSGISSDSSGVSFSVSYDAISKSNKATINPDSSNQYDEYKYATGETVGSTITHYQPADYLYYSHAVAYPSSKLSKEIDETDLEYTRNSVYLLSYYTDNFGGKPPELPEYFGVQSVEENDDSTYSVTLAWKNKVRKSERKPDAYNIYVKSLNADTVELVNKEGPIYFDDSNFIMTYEVDGLKNTSKDYVFYIASADTQTTKGDDGKVIVNAYESILSSPVTANIDKLLDTDGIIITTQPKNCYVENTGDEASFSIDAFDSLGETDKLYYHWQTYDSSSKTWQNVSNDKSTDTKIYVFDTTEDSFGQPIRCLVTKNSSIAENYTATSDAVTVIKGKEPIKPYDFDVDENGNFIIRNYDDLCGMSYMVNSGLDGYTNGKYIVVNDITCPSNAVFTAAGSAAVPFTGEFNGNGYSINGLNITAASSYQGLFGYVSGGKVENFTISGNINCITSGIAGIGGAVGRAENGAVINGVYSTMNISNIEGTSIGHVGGVVGEAISSATVERSIFAGNITVTKSNDCIGGIVGYAKDYVKITNSANLGTLTVNGALDVPLLGGILGYINNTKFSGLENCYNYGTISTDGSTAYVGAIVGWARDSSSYTKMNNNYYLDTSYANPFGSSGRSGTAYSKIAEQFSIGEVAYLLNSEVTDGTQVWYQNIDNSYTPDNYPLLVNNGENTVYKVNLKDKTYSNYNAEPSIICNSDIRTYLRIEGYKEDYHNNIINGFGNVDEKTKTITVYATINDDITTEKVGILHWQGYNGSGGTIELVGDYPKTKETSAYFISNGIEEADIYTDGNDCIFITIPEDRSPVTVKVRYTQKETATQKYAPTEYTLTVVTTDQNPEKYEGVTLTSQLYKSDPDYKSWQSLSSVISKIKNYLANNKDDIEPSKPSEPSTDNNPATSDEPSDNTVISDNTTVDTGNEFNAVFIFIIMISALAVVFICRKKHNN